MSPVNERYVLPVPKYPRLLAPLLRWFQRRCRHYGLKADVLEGCAGDYAVRWCETCGAISTVVDGAPTPIRDCEPTFETNDDETRNTATTSAHLSRYQIGNRKVTKIDVEVGSGWIGVAILIVFAVLLLLLR